MRESNWRNKQMTLGLLAIGCILADAGFVMVLGGALKWLAELTSPLVLACLAAIVIVAVRICWTLRLEFIPVNTFGDRAHRVRSGTAPRARAGSQIQCSR